MPHQEDYQKDPDKFGQRDVSDLRTDFGRVEEKIRNLEKTMVTKEMLAEGKVKTAVWMVQILIPLFAAVLGAAVMVLFD